MACSSDSEEAGELGLYNSRGIDRAPGGTRCPPVAVVRNNSERGPQIPVSASAFSSRRRTWHATCTHSSRVPPVRGTQELVRVLQRYVIYAIRRNDNGYLHGEHRERRAEPQRWRRRRRRSISRRKNRRNFMYTSRLFGKRRKFSNLRKN